MNPGQKLFRAIMVDAIDILRNIKSIIFPAPRDAARFATPSAPKGWHRAAKEAIKEPGSAFMVEQDGKVFYGFSHKEFDRSVLISHELTNEDRKELAKRKLNPENENYTLAKRIFAENPAIKQREIHELLPAIALSTYKDVLAAFKAAIAPPTQSDSVGGSERAGGNAVEIELSPIDTTKQSF